MSKGYRAYLDGGKTERECVKETVAQAREAGYIDLAEAVAAGKKLKGCLAWEVSKDWKELETSYKDDLWSGEKTATFKVTPADITA